MKLLHFQLFGLFLILDGTWSQSNDDIISEINNLRRQINSVVGNVKKQDEKLTKLEKTVRGLGPEKDKEHTCKYVTGYGTGTSYEKLGGYYDKHRCKVACLRRKNWKQEVTGAAIHTDGSCYCVYNMNAIDVSNNGYTSCFFDDSSKASIEEKHYTCVLDVGYGYAASYATMREYMNEAQCVTTCVARKKTDRRITGIVTYGGNTCHCAYYMYTIDPSNAKYKACFLKEIKKGEEH